jgi:preprotein translocase subunit SecF
MATVDPERPAGPPLPGDGTTSPGAAPDAPPPAGRRHSRWLWVSVLLGVAVVGLLVWGLSKNADLNDAQDQLDQQAANGAAAATTAKSAYDDVTKDLASTSQELDATEQDVKDAEAQAAKAQQDADAAKQQAAQANDATEKAQADAKAAQAEAQAAKSKAQVVTGCAQSYLSALGTLFEGDDVQAQAAKVKEQLQGITADCKAAFAGS